MEKKKHFVLVHGAGHGAWCWYKVATLLNSAGHRVTAPDLAASGVSAKQLSELNSMSDYIQPLTEIIASLPPNEKIILVGHSMGGHVISLAMERFSEKIEVAVFIAALMPSRTTPISVIIKEFPTKFDSFMDSKFTFDRGHENPPTSMIFGPEFLASTLYQRCKPEDVTLATMLVRPIRMFEEDTRLSEENYGAVNRVYIVCKEDKVFNEDFQRWMIDCSPVNEVMQIDGSDHMAMLSKPHELCLCLLEIANKHA